MNYIYKSLIHPILSGFSFRRDIDASTQPCPSLRLDSLNSCGGLPCWCGCPSMEADEEHRKMSNQLLLKLFHIFDSQASGSLTPHQLRDLLRFLGYNPSEVQVAILISHVDSEEGRMDLRRFIHFMKSFVPRKDALAELREVFRVLDPCGRGRIRKSKLRAYFPPEAVLGTHEESGGDEATFEDFARLLLTTSGTVVR
uniref:Calmodulin n=1 Tax=Caligus clemensi TaxID=344056 RepID=C1C060_CALCM|nr:Calmodulin [Caligus clemensi]ACO14893.1 Calmodulin [Caligus clemensi]